MDKKKEDIHTYHFEINKILWRKFKQTIDNTSNPKNILTEFVEKRIEEFSNQIKSRE